MEETSKEEAGASVGEQTAAGPSAGLPPSHDVSRTGPAVDAQSNGDLDDADEDEEEETCGFCIYMKGGGCKKEFVAWSRCVDEGREDGRDFATECRQQTRNLQACMQRNRDYYGEMLMEQELDSSEGGEGEEENNKLAEEEGAPHASQRLAASQGGENQNLERITPDSAANSGSGQGSPPNLEESQRLPEMK